jgi:hypothetical protein
MRTLALIVIFLASGNARAADCPWDSTFVSSAAKPQQPHHFRGVSRAMSVQSIIRQLGPAARDAGSGVHVLQWDVTDGRIFFVSSASACGKPLNTGFHRAGPNNSFKPKPLRGSA